MRSARAAASVVAALSVALVACGDDEPSYCADRDALQQSISGVAEVDVVAEGVNALRDQLRRVEADARALADSAQDEYGSEADDLRSSVSALGTSVEKAVASPSAGTLGAVGTQISEVQEAFRRLSDAVSSSC
ncbi:MAG TPA: hypothetical protein VFR97_14440 [Capillimicrobium sp.]|nr:hypothetical protein [Capillimicrobium sp.]